jgi:hypothetical protein
VPPPVADRTSPTIWEDCYRLLAMLRAIGHEI